MTTRSGSLNETCSAAVNNTLKRLPVSGGVCFHSNKIHSGTILQIFLSSQIKLIASVLSDKRQSERNYTRCPARPCAHPVQLENPAKNSSRFSSTY